MNLKTKILINKKTKQLSIALQKKKIRDLLKGGLYPKYAKIKLMGFIYEKKKK